jgi:hypothetical protein
MTRMKAKRLQATDAKQIGTPNRMEEGQKQIHATCACGNDRKTGTLTKEAGTRTLKSEDTSQMGKTEDSDLVQENE